MNILLIGNYPLGEQRSMHCFADLLRRMLEEAGHRVTLARPTPILGYGSATAGLGKWLGYVDRFALFRPTLGRCAASADVVHICDQANAVYVSLLEDRPHIVTCHDTLAIRSALNEIEENPTRWSGRVYQRWILGSLRRAQHVVCVSDRTRMELSRLGGMVQERVSVVPNALHYPYRPMARGEALERIRRWGIPEEHCYFLHVGCNVWYKNRPGVVRIFAKLVAASRFAHHHLVMVGESWPPALRRLVQDTELGARVHELVGVGNEDLRAFYSRAQALIFPSLQEGFGWPVIEAQACGCPVVVSDRPPMAEVAGDAAVRIDPRDEQAAAHLIEQTLAARRGSLVRKGLENAGRYSRQRMLEGYLDAYRRVSAAAQRQ
jgi:glycosyltransferase involved in cell wall biosynthesis